MEKCVVCGKKTDKFIKKAGKTFCCTDCLKQFEDKNKPDIKANVCEFC